MGYLKYERIILFSIISFACMLMIMIAGMAKDVDSTSAAILYTASLSVIAASAIGLGVDYLIEKS